jgi:hypothetical protein
LNCAARTFPKEICPIPTVCGNMLVRMMGSDLEPAQ